MVWVSGAGKLVRKALKRCSIPKSGFSQIGLPKSYYDGEEQLSTMSESRWENIHEAVFYCGGGGGGGGCC